MSPSVPIRSRRNCCPSISAVALLSLVFDPRLTLTIRFIQLSAPTWRYLLPIQDVSEPWLVGLC